MLLSFCGNDNTRTKHFDKTLPICSTQQLQDSRTTTALSRTVECTKRATTFGLWGLWSLFGAQLFTDMVDVTFALGQDFHAKLSAVDDFTPLHRPECNIVVFRYTPQQLADAPEEQVGHFQMALRRRLIESGQFYIVSTNIDGVGALRVVFMNPLTTGEHLDQLLDTLRELGDQILGENNPTDLG